MTDQHATGTSAVEFRGGPYDGQIREIKVVGRTLTSPVCQDHGGEYVIMAEACTDFARVYRWEQAAPQ